MSESRESFKEMQNTEENEEGMEEDEEEDDSSEDNEEGDKIATGETTCDAPRAHLPNQPLEEGEELVMDEQAYLVYHQVNK